MRAVGIRAVAGRSGGLGGVPHSRDYAATDLPLKWGGRRSCG